MTFVQVNLLLSMCFFYLTGNNQISQFFKSAEIIKHSEDRGSKGDKMFS